MWKQTWRELRSSNWNMSDSIPLLRNNKTAWEQHLPHQVSHWKQIWSSNKATVGKWAKQGTAGLLIYSGVSTGYFAYQDMNRLCKYMASI